MKVSGSWIADKRTQKVCRVLTEAGYRALFVGGCVRNALLQEPVGDIDISTDARPETVSDLARKAGLKCVPTGIEHGTVTVVAGGLPHEITTFRRDVETDGRRAVVAFTTRVEEDARRRDLTINALYAKPDGTVVDPLGGLPDLRARRIRFIEDPEARIREDYLRILRFFRFFAWYGDPEQGLDPDGLAACAALSGGLDTLSKERVGAEVLKLLAAPDPGPACAALAATGGLQRILPGSDTRALGPLIHLEQAAAAEPDAIRRLAVLGGENATTLLRLSRKNARHLTELQAAAAAPMPATELGYRLGRETARDALLVRCALLQQTLPPGADADIRAGAAATFPIAAADLYPRYHGRALGEALRACESEWIASGFTKTRDELLSR